jgi:hypothetical protein
MRNPQVRQNGEAGDETILDLFRGWWAARARADRVSADDDAAFDAAYRMADLFEDAISATPASGALGLAVKVYIALAAEGGAPGDMVSLSARAIRCSMHRGILNDVVRFLPEVAPFTRKAIAAAD